MAADPLDLERLEQVAKAATPGPWIQGWWTGQAEDKCDCSLKGKLIAKVPQTQYPGAGPFHVHETDLCEDEHAVSAAAPMERIAGNYDYEEGGIIHGHDAAFIAAFNPATALALIAALRAEQARVREAETKAASLETVLDADERNEDLFAHMRQHCHDQIKDIWGAMCFDWDSAPETLKREAHKVARQGLDDVLTKLTKLTPRMSPWKQALDELHVTNWIGVIDGLTPGEAVRKLLECALDQERDELRAEVRALREQVKGLETALEDIANPIAAFQREAEKTGGSLTAAAYYLSNDPNYLKTIARDALREVRSDE